MGFGEPDGDFLLTSAPRLSNLTPMNQSRSLSPGETLVRGDLIDFGSRVEPVRAIHWHKGFLGWEGLILTVDMMALHGIRAVYASV